ncbi:flagellin FliC [Candidatus Dependentiae bacterium]|nr:flagellin FliC [Candidatus Dependentiae bacterium]
MSLRIMNNVEAQFAHRQLSLTNGKLNKSLEKLSSGYRINHAADDAAGLAISEKLRTQVNGLEQSRRNIMDGISLLQTAEGGLDELHSILQRMRVLSIQASNGTLTTTDRGLIQSEVDQLLCEIDRMSSTVTFNNIQLFNYTDGSLKIQAGASQGQTLTVTLSSISTTDLSIDGLSITSTTGAESAITLLTTAIDNISRRRATIGAMQNRLEHTYNFAGISRENQMAAESRIRDVDFAEEMITFTKTQILAQAGNSMLAQANLRPQAVLQLLG